MSETVEVYVQLLNEGATAWRPTQADVVGPEVVRLLPAAGYDPLDEAWEFLPGTAVRIAPVALQGGTFLVALAPADPEQHRCRVCGLRIGDFLAWADLMAHPRNNRCPCCGVDWGTSDTLDVSCRTFREAWLAGGAPWNCVEKRPSGWSLQEQLAHVPPGSRGPAPAFGTPNARVRIQLVRHSHKVTGKFRCYAHFADERASYACELVFGQEGQRTPDLPVSGTATFLYPELVADRLRVGVRFTLREAGEDVGDAEVLEVLGATASSAEWNQAELAQLAHAVLNGGIDVIAGVRKMSMHVVGSGLADDPDGRWILSLSADTDPYPVGATRLLWDPGALAERDEWMKKFLARASPEVMDGCRRLLERLTAASAKS